MSLALTERQAREIEVFCQIARENGAAISLRELIGLAGLETSEPELAEAILADSSLGSRLLLESGYVFERQGGAGSAPPSPSPPATTTTATTARSVLADQQRYEDRKRRRARAEANLKRASAFGRFLVPGSVVVSVSGANSYLSAREDEDIDFFCVTKTDGLWAFMLKALILARVNRLMNRDEPPFCLSCIMDEDWAAKAFTTRQPLIFARDALTVKLIGGIDAYHKLIDSASWMEGYFPVLYRTRLRETDPGARSGPPPSSEGRPRPGSAAATVANAFLCCVLGSFLRMKSWALNRKLTRAAWFSAIFDMKFGRGHYIFESKRYERLRAMYGELEEGQ
jgi:hypothetical protein